MAQVTGTNEQFYQGDEKLVVAIDLGTTHSAVSFAHLYPEQRVDVRMVTKWAGQPEYRGDSKIPTLVAYVDGTALACGAEAREFIGNEGCELARWFKLHLHPKSMANVEGDAFEIPELPQNVTLRQVYSDFLGYMFRSTRTYFEENTVNGADIWSRLQDHITIVLAHPNGWDIGQHTFLKQAAIEGGLLNEENADLLLEFVTESEASVHYAIARTRSHTWLATNSMFMVCDAGGSTVDSVLYECTESEARLTLKEVCASECIQAGGVFVDRAIERLLTERLAGSKFSGAEYIGDMVENFEAKAKRIFDGSQESGVLDFGGRRDTDRPYNILQGKLSLSKADVSNAFEGVVKDIVNSSFSLLGGRKIKHLLLVGGFGDAPFLRKRLKEAFGEYGTEVVVVDEPSKKAAAEGGALWFAKQVVVARAARFTLGVWHSTPFNQANPEHRRRIAHTFLNDAGQIQVRDAFTALVEKNFIMEQSYQVSRGYRRQYKQRPTMLEDFEANLHVWEGEGTLRWTTDESGKVHSNFRKLCTLKADLSRLENSLTAQIGLDNQEYWRVDFNFVLSFGGTKLHVRLQWEDDDGVHEGPVTILASSLF